MRRIVAVIAATACTVLMAGCATARPLPPGLTQGEVKALIAAQNDAWWYSMFPDEPPPVVDPIEFVPIASGGSQNQKCVVDATVEGVSESSGDASPYTDAEAEDAFNRAIYVCALSYPTEISDPTAMGYLSDEQSDYLYDYFDTRLVPCLRSVGYAVAALPSRENFREIGGYWLPYLSLSPQPSSEAEWNAIDAKCPPAPIGPSFPGGF